MAQVGWVWVNDNGAKYRVGIYHGDQSGHVAIHCNLRVVQIDFSVKESRTYSFFIEEELCEIRLEKHKAGHFTYDFQINKTVNTPRNQIRKADERQIRKHLTWFVAGLVAFLLAVFVGLKFYGKQQREKEMSQGSWISGLNEKNVTRLSLEGETTNVTIRQEELAGKPVLQYQFITKNSQTITDNIPVETPGPPVLPNGFPLQNGDAFSVRYLPSNPEIHRIDFYQPIRSTLEAYMARSTVAEQQANPQQTPEQCACIARMTLEVKGWKSLAYLLDQQISEKENPRYNRNTYLRMVREPAFNKILKEQCWVGK